MNKSQKVFLAVVSIAILCATATVTASSKISGTPLYTFRMEQVSSKMNFLPTAMNEVVYTARNGYTLDCGIFGGYCDVGPFKVPAGGTCSETCPETCEDTCPLTRCLPCNDTYGDTCPNTCETCPLTCPATCLAFTNCLPCNDTYGDTCPDTCETCYNTCPATCAATC